MTDTVIPIVLGTLLVVAFIYSIAVIYHPKRLLLPMVIMATTMWVPFYIYNPITDVLGYPVQSSKEEIGQFLTYRVDADQEWIFIWVYDAESDEPIALKIPYTKEDEEKLNETERKAQEGIPQQITVPGTERIQGNDNSNGGLYTEDLPDGGGSK